VIATLEAPSLSPVGTKRTNRWRSLMFVSDQSGHPMNADGAVATIAALPRGAVVGSIYLNRRLVFGAQSGL